MEMMYEVLRNWHNKESSNNARKRCEKCSWTAQGQLKLTMILHAHNFLQAFQGRARNTKYWLLSRLRSTRDKLIRIRLHKFDFLAVLPQDSFLFLCKLTSRFLFLPPFSALAYHNWGVIRLRRFIKPGQIIRAEPQWSFIAFGKSM